MISRELSAASRRVTLGRLAREHWDLLVIGGGITGAGVALEAALRGLKVALVERGDFAIGTSSRSSKLLHGGLRYLEYGEVRLVHEALTQRNKLFKHAPHLAHELPFLFPIYREYGDSLTVIDAGLWLYDTLSSASELSLSRLHRRMRPAEVVREEPAMKLDGMKGALAYIDGLTDDARMVVETLKTAVGWGAALANYVEVTGFLNGPDGKVTGARLRDVRTGKGIEVHARRVVNAGGPWVDRINRLSDPEAKPRLKPTKGVHLMVRKFTERAIVFKSHEPADPKKKRIMFIIPFGGRTMIGTTDTAAHHAPGDDRYLDDELLTTPEEIRYLLDSVNAVCPTAALTPDDVIATFGGYRPLVAPLNDDVAESAISREHEIFTNDAGVVAVAGGKYTTFRAMGRQVVETVVKSLRSETWLPDQTTRHADEVPLSGGDLPSGNFESYMAYAIETHPGIEPALVGLLVSRYGTNYHVLLSLIEADRSLDRPVLGLSPETPLLRAEIAYFVRYELALSLSDVLMRRTRLSLLDARRGVGAAEEVAAVMSGVLQVLEGWTEEERADWVQREVDEYLKAIARENAAAGSAAGLATTASPQQTSPREGTD